MGARGAMALMRWLLGLTVLAALLPAGLLFALTDPAPSQARTAMVSLRDLERGQAIVQSLGLRRMRDGQERQWVIAESDLDRGLNYLAARFARGSAGAQIALGRLILQASLPLPVARLGLKRYLNLELTLAPRGELLAPETLRLGRVRLPAFLAGPLLAWGLDHSAYAGEFAAAREMLDSAQVGADTLALRFTWRAEALERALGRGAPGPENALLENYRTWLGQVRTRDLAVLVGEAYALAKTRSAAGHDPVAENRAALTVLAEITLGGRLFSGKGMAADLGRHTGMRLAGREDFAQHFALSAFLAATGGGGISDLAGLYKELQDAREGSGFSFTDLAADRAGSRFGEASTRSPEAARQIQARLAGSRDAGRYFPPARDLPEFMRQAEFAARFGGLGQPAYQAMVFEIERRIAGLAVYR